MICLDSYLWIRKFGSWHWICVKLLRIHDYMNLNRLDDTSHFNDANMSFRGNPILSLAVLASSIVCLQFHVSYSIYVRLHATF